MLDAMPTPVLTILGGLTAAAGAVAMVWTTARAVWTTWPRSEPRPVLLAVGLEEPAGVAAPIVTRTDPRDVAPRRARCRCSPADPPRRGLSLYAQNCTVCHEQGLGRPIQGLFGSTLELEGGGTVVVDEPFIIQSLLDPPAHVTSGSQPIMPTFKGQMNPYELRELVELHRWCRDRPLPGRDP